MSSDNGATTAGGVHVPRANELQEELMSTKQELTEVTEAIKKLQSRRRDLEERVGVLKSEFKLLNDADTAWTKFDTDTFDWSKKVKSVLKSVFKIEDFRSYQKAAINATMSGLDAILIMPTGGGKSLVFQLPAVVSNGVTLVVSPLISLMEDQLQSLQALGISTYIFNSQTGKEETKAIFGAMIDAKSDLKLLYVTPEKLAKSKRLMSQLEKMYRMGRFARLVIDEVHCCSQWGHDFRKDYTFLGIMKTQYPKTPILGLTATATANVIVDIQKMLNIEGCLTFKDSFFRSNLKYEVHDIGCKDKTDDIVDLIKKRFSGQTGIIYCLTIKDCEEVCQKIRSLGIKARPYHAQLEPELRTKAQQGWYAGHYQVIVATVAFGMGINKLDVRFIIHHSISKSLENYYQETGRAGRDGLPAYCILYYRFQDIFRATSLMVTEKTGVKNVYTMLKYSLEKTICRKAMIAQHFGDTWDPTLCTGMCDNCDDSRKRSYEIKIYPLLQDLHQIFVHNSQIEERMTALKLMDAWFGKGSKKNRAEEVSIPKYSREVCEVVIATFLIDGYLKEEFHFNPYTVISYLNVGPKMLMINDKSKDAVYTIKIKTDKNSSSMSSSSTGNHRSSLSTKTPSSAKKKESEPPPKKKVKRIESSSESDIPEIVDLDD